MKKPLSLELTHDEYASLRHYLFFSVCMDSQNEVCYNTVASAAACGNEMAIKAMDIRRKILEKKIIIKKSFKVDWEYKILDFIKRIFKRGGKK